MAGMHILLITGEFPPMQGGVGDYTREMAREFVAQGHQVSVLVPAPLAAAYAGAVEQPWSVLARIDGWKWGCWRQIMAVVEEVRPDVIDIQYQAAAYDMRSPAINLLPWYLRRRPDTPPTIVTFHDLKPPFLFPKAGPVRTWAVRRMAGDSAAAIVTNSEDAAAAGRWSFAGPGRPAVHQIPIGSNIPVQPPPGFDRAAWRARYGLEAHHFVWAYFGFLNESKGGETLLRALALAPETHQLLMIGGRVGASDPTNQVYAARVEQWIAAWGLEARVHWMGYVPPAEVSAALLAADVAVLPYRDGVSLRRGSLHAALAHGCPIVSTWPRVPLAELHPDRDILLVPPEDPAALSQAVQRLAQDPARRESIGRGARRLAGQFTWEQIARRTVEQVFLPLIGERPRRQPAK